MVRWAIALSIVLVFATGAWAAAEDLDAKVRAIAEQLMCPVCEGRTVADSPATLAAQMRGLIREKLLAGETPDQIVAYFVDRYGESILASPPRRGLNWGLWVAPFLFLGAGSIFLAGRLRQWVHDTQADAGREADPLDPTLLHRLAQELEELDRGSEPQRHEHSPEEGTIA